MVSPIGGVSHLSVPRMNRFRAHSPRLPGVCLPALSLVIALANGCGGDSTAPNTNGNTTGIDRVEIVYSLDPAGQSDARDLYVMNSDGSANRSLLALPGDESFPSWSPDGHSLVFQHDSNGVAGLWRANEDGSNPTHIPTAPIGLPRWSADGSWIIFAASTPGSAELVAVHPDGTGRRSLTGGITGVMLSPAAWSKTGRIAFMRSNGSPGKGNIWSMNADGTGLTQLSTGVQDQLPVWSPDGSVLAYTQWTPVPDPSGYVAQVVVVNANGTGTRVVTGANGSTNNILADWSPDGQWLLYQHRGVENGQSGCWFERVPVGGGAAIRVIPKLSGAECGGAGWRSRRPS